jgi:hypothetical protein
MYVISMADQFQGEQYLQWQGQLMTQPAAMKSSSVGPALTAAFACTGTAAVGVAGTDALSACFGGGGAGAADTSSNGCWLVTSVRDAPASPELTLDMVGMGEKLKDSKQLLVARGCAYLYAAGGALRNTVPTLEHQQRAWRLGS